MTDLTTSPATSFLLLRNCSQRSCIRTILEQWLSSKVFLRTFF
jgi:hypothetical protein